MEMRMGALRVTPPLMQPATAQECARGMMCLMSLRLLALRLCPGISGLSGHPGQRHCTAPTATASGGPAAIRDTLNRCLWHRCGANSPMEDMMARPNCLATFVVWHCIESDAMSWNSIALCSCHSHPSRRQMEHSGIPMRQPISDPSQRRCSWLAIYPPRGHSAS